jgi:hypothetical protein
MQPNGLNERLESLGDQTWKWKALRIGSMISYLCGLIFVLLTLSHKNIVSAQHRAVDILHFDGTFIGTLAPFLRKNIYPLFGLNLLEEDAVKMTAVVMIIITAIVLSAFCIWFTERCIKHKKKLAHAVVFCCSLLVITWFAEDLGILALVLAEILLSIIGFLLITPILILKAIFER